MKTIISFSINWMEAPRLNKNWFILNSWVLLNYNLISVMWPFWDQSTVESIKICIELLENDYNWV